jgi:phosphoribosyl 1,2-cyclic phosphodiesterase
MRVQLGEGLPGARIRFLGTGASGGTPGVGRSRRMESSLLASSESGAILVDAGGDFEEQSQAIDSLDAVALTHGHSDACGGLGAVDRWLRNTGRTVPVLARRATLDVVRRRFGPLENCELRPFEPGDRTRIAGWTLSCRAVPHAGDADRYPTVAWRLTTSGRSVAYASDLARPTIELREFARSAAVLVVDGATSERRIFSHLRIDEDLPDLCEWPVDRIYLTQIGKSAPQHDRLQRVISDLCPRATPAFDGLEIEV